MYLRCCGIDSRQPQCRACHTEVSHHQNLGRGSCPQFIKITTSVKRSKAKHKKTRYASIACSDGLFLRCEFWQIVSVKELVHFVCVIKFVCIKLFTVFLYCPFNVHRIYSEVSSFISDMSNSCPFSVFLS